MRNRIKCVLVAVFINEKLSVGMAVDKVRAKAVLAGEPFMVKLTYDVSDGFAGYEQKLCKVLHDIAGCFEDMLSREK